MGRALSVTTRDQYCPHFSAAKTKKLNICESFSIHTLDGTEVISRGARNGKLPKPQPRGWRVTSRSLVLLSAKYPYVETRNKMWQRKGYREQSWEWSCWGNICEFRGTKLCELTIVVWEAIPKHRPEPWCVWVHRVHQFRGGRCLVLARGCFWWLPNPSDKVQTQHCSPGAFCNFKKRKKNGENILHSFHTPKVHQIHN